MFRRFTLFIVFALVLFSAPVFAAPYTIDTAHTRIGFGAKHMVISTVQGEFEKFSGAFEMDGNGVLESVKALIDVGSINTRDDKRDNHLRSPDFFNVEKFPTITFVSKKVTHDGNKYTIVGDLTIKAVTKPVTLTGEVLGQLVDPWGNHRVGFHAGGKINRKDFGINFNKILDTGGLVVSDMVTITLDIEGIQKK